MRAFNEAKVLALRFIGEVGEATANQVADYLDFTPAGASSYLRKLNRQGLINRRKLTVGTRRLRERVYWLSEKGSRKLAWLEAEKEVIYSDFADVEEVIEQDDAFVAT